MSRCYYRQALSLDKDMALWRTRLVYVRKRQEIVGKVERSCTDPIDGATLSFCINLSILSSCES